MLSLLLTVALAADPVAPAVVHANEAPTYVIAGGKGQATLLLNATQGAPAAVDTLVLAPGAEVPPHKHDASAEILVITEGRTRVTIAGTAYEAGPGDAVFIPAGAEHAAVVLGTLAPLRAVQIYVGPGPEQRFTTGERATRG
jgi:quercetin dioxygenase-like cupin family protein